MSTRSGRRIHSSFLENTLKTDAEGIIKSERKTRSKRLEDTNDGHFGSTLKLKKRNNYVSYPTDDELLIAETCKRRSEVNPSRVLRKNALQEVNATFNSEALPESTYPTRKSKRGKKLVEDLTENVTGTENIENVQTDNIEKKNSKKNKKKKDNTESNEIVPINKNRKKKRKGRQSNSMVVEDIQTGDSVVRNVTFDKSISVDSFHSAAGSPKQSDIVTSLHTTDEIALERNVMSLGKLSKSRTSINNSGSGCGTPETNMTLTVENTCIVEDNAPQNIDTSHIRRSSRRTLTNESRVDSVSNISLSAGKKRRKSSIIDTNFDKSINSATISSKLDGAIISEIQESQAKKRMSTLIGTFDNSIKLINTTFEKDDRKDSTYDKTTNNILDTTFEKDNSIDSSQKKNRNSINNNTYEKIEKMDTPGSARKKSAAMKFSLTHPSDTDINSDDCGLPPTSKMKSPKLEINETVPELNIIDKANSTFDLETPRQSLHQTSELPSNNNKDIDTTFDKSANSLQPRNNSKSSLISSDNSDIHTSICRISITSDDSSENIINTTPVLIESSMDESHISKDSPVAPQTPLRREGTFTKESPEVIKPVETPSKRATLPAAGYTPYHVSKSSQKKSMLNVTRSIEKGRGSLEAPRATKVMFCSPVDNPALLTQEKRKIIKSNLKGSNKSFVFEDRESPRPVRKRSYTASDADEARAKRSRLAGELQHSVHRLSRPRTSSATAKVPESTTPGQKVPTPSKGGKPSRTKLPNFAALHQRQFAKMESLDECQERKARRAKQLLTPTGAVAVLDRSSPRGTSEPPRAKPFPKKDTPTKPAPTLESLRPGFTRFGFKLNLDVNPFSVPSKTEEKNLVKVKPNGVTRQGPLPSLAGATSVRREAAKQAVMREKSFTDRRHVSRNENRTIIKGVRTNRRFELQMKMRNLE